MTSLGFNMVKHCLYTPVAEYWQACDERGILAWLELPMWLPKVDEAFRRQALTEYREILRPCATTRLSPSSPSAANSTGRSTPSFSKELYDLAKEMTGLPLIRDNSGSAEAYGGNAVEYADFYDYHFYCEPHDFDRLNDAFATVAGAAETDDLR